MMTLPQQADQVECARLQLFADTADALRRQVCPHDRRLGVYLLTDLFVALWDGGNLDRSVARIGTILDAPLFALEASGG